MDCRERRDLDAILFVDHTLVAKIELVRDGFATLDGKTSATSFDIPGPGLDLIFDESLCSETRFCARRTIDVKRRVSSVHPAADV